MSKKNATHKLFCSFCGKEQSMVKRLVAGPGVYICDECIALCNEIVAEENEQIELENQSEFGIQVPKPIEMKKILDQYVIGQEFAKKALSVAVYNHYIRIFKNNSKKNEVELDKSNILMIGPTGSGKTLLAQTLAKILKVPFCIVDATALTEAGYVGEDVENIILKLIQNAGNDLKKAEIGIIYIDEVDKIARKADSPSITRDVSGEGVQQALLKIIEGTIANVPPQGGRKHPHQEYISVDTKNILFILGGAFVDLEKIIKSRVGEKTIGFDSKENSLNEVSKSEITEQVIPEDLMKFGLIPEFIGRLPIITTLRGLSKESLIQVFKEPKNSIYKQYSKMFELENVELEIQEEAIELIAELALKRESGARGLRSIMEDVMLDLMFEIPSRQDVQKVIITKGCLEKTETPKIILKKNVGNEQNGSKRTKIA